MPKMFVRIFVLLALVFVATGLPGESPPEPFVDRVVEFEPGEGAEFGQEKLPDIVLGAPHGAGKLAPSAHVLSLGRGGRITLEFVDNEVFDGDGPDFIVFENAFLKDPGDDPGNGFFELAKVEVSADGKEWKEFPFDYVTRKGCAGHHPVLANPGENDISPTDPEQAGGDPFDLKQVGLAIARFVRITDLDNAAGAKGTAGFDLDAVAAVHSRARPGK
ncbi:MAG: cell surface protein [Planctomycetales bacterium]